MRRWELKKDYQLPTSIKLGKKEIRKIGTNSISLITAIFIIAVIVVVDIGFLQLSKRSKIMRSLDCLPRASQISCCHGVWLTFCVVKT